MDPHLNEQTALGAFYDGWQQYQEQLIRAIAPLSEEQLASRAASDLRTVNALAQHIVGARAAWLHRFLHEGDEDLAAYVAWNRPDGPPRPAPELIAGLAATWTALRACLDRWTPTDLAETVSAERGGQTHTRSRQWVVWHLIEHDLHHGGELSYVLGMHGIRAPDL